MEQIVSIQDKTIEETVNDTELILQQHLEKREYEEIKKTITSNETAPKKILHQRKFRNCNSLKLKPKPILKVNKFAEETGNTENL